MKDEGNVAFYKLNAEFKFKVEKTFDCSLFFLKGVLVYNNGMVVQIASSHQGLVNRVFN